MDKEEKTLVFVAFLIVVLLIGIVIAAYKEAAQWKEFKSAHNCKVTAHISGEVFNTLGISANGQATVGIGSTSSKTGWTCDDGITYYR